MRIVYVAKHDSGGNDDEGAITHALQSLGHDVQRVREVAGSRAHRIDGDFLLFHHWHDAAALSLVKIPKVFWYFDLVEWPNDRTLERRNNARTAWMQKMMPLVQLGFCTDGDWVAKHPNDKLVWLSQGADGRKIGFGKTKLKNGSATERVPILFTGGVRGCGVGRESFVNELTQRYGSRLYHVERGVYGTDLRDLIARSDIVVAPDAPVTSRYWSNRVYNALGFGAFLLHPWTFGLSQHYADENDLVYYSSRQDLYDKIDYYLTDPLRRSVIAHNGLAITRHEHLYLHRCERLITIVKERLCLS